MWVYVLLIILGIVLLKWGAGLLVKGSSDLARKLHVSELAIGLTIVSFGTSAPELVVNGFASLNGNNDLVFGNVIGSNCFNLFIILGIIALIMPVKLQSSTARREVPFSMLALVVFFILVNDHIFFQRSSSRLSRVDGLVMLAGFSLFLLYAFRRLRQDALTEDPVRHRAGNARMAFFIVAGMAGLAGGGKLVLDNAVKLATQLGLSEKVIGMTIVAAGTSLPELATSIVAALKKNVDMAVGNIIGSNISNVLFVLAFSAVLKPLPYNAGFNTDIALITGGTLVLILTMFTGQKRQVDRWEALVLLAGYFVYMTTMVI